MSAILCSIFDTRGTLDWSGMHYVCLQWFKEVMRSMKQLTVSLHTNALLHSDFLCYRTKFPHIFMTYNVSIMGSKYTIKCSARVAQTSEVGDHWGGPNGPWPGVFGTPGIDHYGYLTYQDLNCIQLLLSETQHQTRRSWM